MHYLRTKDGREVDFALVRNNDIEMMLEVKHTNKTISPSLQLFHDKYKFPALQLVKELRNERLVNGIEVRKLISFLEQLSL